MKKTLLIFISMMFFSVITVYGQADEKSKENKSNDQEALDETMVSPEQKKMMKEQEAHYKKIKKEREKKRQNNQKKSCESK